MNQRKPPTHTERCLLTDLFGRDEIDQRIPPIDPLVSGTGNRRSEKQLNRFLDIIDNLPISTNRKGGRP